jgi:hypothetical protein
MNHERKIQSSGTHRIEPLTMEARKVAAPTAVTGLGKLSEVLIHEPSRSSSDENPDRDDCKCGHRAGWALAHRGGLRTMLCHDRGIDETHDARDGEWQQDQLVEVAEEGDEIGDEVDGREGICRDHHGERLRQPRYSRIASRKVERKNIALKDLSPSRQVFKHA